MRVFITGGAGFIGSYLCDALVAEGKAVTILDNLSTRSKKYFQFEGKIKVFQGDIRDQKLVESLVEGSDLVLHMAAALGIDNILENPIESISTNFYGSEMALNAAIKHDKRIIIASSLKSMGRTRSNHCLKLITGLLVLLKGSNGHILMLNHLKNLRHIFCL